MFDCQTKINLLYIIDLLTNSFYCYRLIPRYFQLLPMSCGTIPPVFSCYRLLPEKFSCARNTHPYVYLRKIKLIEKLFHTTSSVFLNILPDNIQISTPESLHHMILTIIIHSLGIVQVLMNIIKWLKLYLFVLILTFDIL
jgi:hypothetical protein